MLANQAIALPTVHSDIIRRGLTNPNGAGVLFKNSLGIVKPLLNMSMNGALFTYTNGTMYGDYRGKEDRQAIFSFQVQSFGNGTLDLRFKGSIPFKVIHSATTSSYDTANGWQRLTYTAVQNSTLTIIFANPKLSLGAGAWIAALALVFLVVARTAYIFYEPDQEGRYSVILKNRKIFLSMCLVVFLIYLATLLFP